MALSLAAMGSYIVGGRYVSVSGQPLRELTLSSGLTVHSDPNGTYVIEGAYVQYFEPAALNGRPPILLVHGGGLTGSCWETTPDGRPGWLNRLLEGGFAVHVIDNVERGRAGFCALDDVWAGKPVGRSEQEMWSLFRFGLASDYDERRAFSGQQFPVSFLRELAARAVPRWTSNTDAQVSALTDAVRRLGKVILIGHSQGGGHVVRVAELCRENVAAVVAIEPHGAPTCVDRGLGLPPLTIVEGDFLVEGGAQWGMLREAWDKAASAWVAAGGSVDVLNLPAIGINGNSHLPMMDRNSDEALAAIVRQLP